MPSEAAAIVRALGADARGARIDSRAIERGDLFLAAPGESGDGRDFIAAAVANGAAGVLWEPTGFRWPGDGKTAHAPVPGLRARAGEIADIVYGQPTREVTTAAVTGTNGKTTISHFAAQLFARAGAPCAVVGTLGAGIFRSQAAGDEDDDEWIDLPTTTPDAPTLHFLAARFRARGAARMIVEASSHGLAQGRLGGARIETAVCANIGRDHLDYHRDWESYRAAKESIFSLPGIRAAVLCADDPACAAIAAKLRDGGLRTMTVGDDEADARITALADDGFSFAAEGVERRAQVEFFGAHNARNFLAAALVARAAGIEWDEICESAPFMRAPRGRLTRVEGGGNDDGAPAVYIDYAHTAEALEAALEALSRRQADGGEIVAVFGCGGARDRGKRAAMGAAAARWAARVVLTDDNPRDEESSAIIADILRGVDLPRARIEIEPDRRLAIARAVALAGANDAVLVAGKGHETTQEKNGVKRPFSDFDAARAALAARRK